MLQLVRAHDLFRIGFIHNAQDGFKLHIAPLQEINIETNDWSHHPKHVADEFLNTFIQADRRLGFSPLTPPLFRVALLKLVENRYTIILSFFSAIADERQILFILKDLFAIYNKRWHPYVPQPSQHTLDEDIQRSFNPAAMVPWKIWFSDVAAPLFLPFAFIKPKVKTNRRAQRVRPLTTQVQQAVLSPDVTRQLHEFCTTNKIEMDFLLMGIFAIILSHYSGEAKIFFCIRCFDKSGVAGPGNNANILPAKFVVDPGQLLTRFLLQIKEAVHEIQNLEQASLSQIRSEIRGTSNTDLFDIAFSFEKQCAEAIVRPNADIPCNQGIRILKRTPFSLFLSICGKDQLSVSLDYDRRRFDKNSIMDILRHITTALTAIPGQGDLTLSQIPILTPQEKHEIAQQLNPVPMPQRPDSCLHHLFEIQATSNRDNEALAIGSLTLKYGQLNDKANQIANYLNSLGTRPQSRVMVMLESNPDLIPFYLGILKAGCIILPISTRQPEKHLQTNIDALQPDLVITSKKWAATLFLPADRIMDVDNVEQAIDQAPTSPTGISADPESIAFVLGTSGKAQPHPGVMAAHYCLVSYARSAIDLFDILPTDRLFIASGCNAPQFASQVFLSFLSGATLVMPPWKSQPSAQDFSNFCIAQGVTILVIDEDARQGYLSTPSLFLPECLRLVILNHSRPEDPPLKTIKAKIATTTQIIATYGQAETSGAVLWTELPHALLQTPPLWRPFPGNCFTLLNRFLQPALPNTTGELYIGGMQVAQGYFNSIETNRGAFKKIGFMGDGIRFFKTGKQARRLSDGSLAFHPIPPPMAAGMNMDRAPSNQAVQAKPLIILVGNSARAAQSYKKADRLGYDFFHSPIFIHFYDPRGLHHNDLDIPGIAEKCIQDIRDTHPHGPYILIGICQNAVVAHEIAIQLKCMGIDLALLIVIDENWQAAPGNRSTNSLPFFQKQIRELKTRGMGYLFFKFKKRLKNLRVKAISSLDSLREKLCIMARLPVPASIQYRTLEQIYYRACEKHPYTPPTYEGRVVLLYSRGWEKKFNPQLNRYYTGPIKKVSLAIDHSEWFRPKQIQFILKEILRHG